MAPKKLEIMYNLETNKSELLSFEMINNKNAPKLLERMFCHDSVIVDDIIYTGGGFSKKFDPREGRWSFLTDITTRAYYTAMSSFEQTIACSGDYHTESACQVYDIKNDKWHKIADLTIPTFGARSIENKTSIIVAGGRNFNTIQSYDKRNKTWSILDIRLPFMNSFSSKIWL
uniref:Kelch repeat protein n=1 Tax=Rhabditophanes sp. KR3021 TaxID=114890 RepID=A0AC35TZB1_9BILA